MTTTLQAHRELRDLRAQFRCVSDTIRDDVRDAHTVLAHLGRRQESATLEDAASIALLALDTICRALSPTRER